MADTHTVRKKALERKPVVHVITESAMKPMTINPGLVGLALLLLLLVLAAVFSALSGD